MKVELLKEQIQNAYNWTDKLLDSILVDTWDVIPGIIKYNINWQLATDFEYLFSFSYCDRGHQKNILKRIGHERLNLGLKHT